MKISQSWLQEWLSFKIEARQWASKLNRYGFEIASIEQAAPAFNSVVVGRVVHCEKHPNADRLSYCQVDVGKNDLLSIVCGAKNVRAGLNVAVALVGAVLPGGLKIKKAKLRNIISEGMICSAKELGLTDDECSGILELADDAPLGKLFRDYWNLDDEIVDLEITPNRGDCLSMKGIAREIAAVERKTYIPIKIKTIKPTIKDIRRVDVQNKAAAPRYVGRIIRHINAKRPTPLYVKERLQKCGLRSVNVVVDVLNYVMLEIGQPMHAFDLGQLTGNITVRSARSKEVIKLLDHSEIQLSEDTLVIADEREPCAIAGIMGGLSSGVTFDTKDIFLESAFFSPDCVCRSTQQYGLHSDSSYRFERGVDPQLQRIAIERATELLCPLIGGDIGPIIESIASDHLPGDKKITLRKSKIATVLGIDINDKIIIDILKSLQMNVTQKTGAEWDVTVPSYRFDIEQEIDLIEEVIRLYGYEHISRRSCVATITQLDTESEKRISPDKIGSVLVNRGYNEIVTYSFVDKGLHSLLTADEQAIRLSNPLNVDMAFMRTSLWPGLVKTAIYNQNRQVDHIRLFEIGLCFKAGFEEKIIQNKKIGGLVTGSIHPSQWGIKERAVDFFDIKGDIQALIQLTHRTDAFSFKPCNHEVLYPSQSAAVYNGHQCVGYIGALHPALVKQLKLASPVYLFEFLLEPFMQAKASLARVISKFPSIRRDIALIVDRKILAKDIIQFIKSKTEFLVNIQVFDRYIGENVGKDKQSIALRLTFCNISRTLREQEINDQLSKLVLALQHQFKAILRGSS